MQTINLHKAQFPPKESIKVSGKLSAIIIIVFVVIISAISLFYWKIESLRSEYEEFKKSKSVTEIALNKLKSDLKESANEDQLKIDLLDIKEKLKHKEALKSKIQDEASDGDISFYKRFISLSKLDIRGLWLNEINFGDHGNHLTLYGSAQSPKLITQYIQRLTKEPVFSGVNFILLNISESETAQKSFDFTISTEEIIEEEATPLENALEKFQNVPK